jgi:hypothetical protein
VPAVFYIALFLAFDMKLVLLAWRSHHAREMAEGQQVFRKKIVIFYIKFCTVAPYADLALFLYITLTIFFSNDEWMIILQYLILFPQIVYNVRVGNNPGFEPWYIFGFVGCRLLIPLYERGCPSNHFMLTPMYELLTIIFGLYAIHVTILVWQYRRGPRFFIPRMLQSDYFNYNYKLKADTDNRLLECSICL